MPKDDLFNLDTINLGFVRPKSSLDWQMAYCQAQLYAQYMLKTYGDDALAKMLAAYRDNLDTRDALKRSFDVEQADFEAGYLDYREKHREGVVGRRPRRRNEVLGVGESPSARSPTTADAAAKLAAAYVAREEYPEARKLADKVLDEDAEEPDGRLRAGAGPAGGRRRRRGGEAARRGARSRRSPTPRRCGSLASLKFKADGLRRGRGAVSPSGAEKFPYDAKWKKALAKIYLVSEERSEARAGAWSSWPLADADDGVDPQEARPDGARRGRLRRGPALGDRGDPLRRARRDGPSSCRPRRSSG